MSRSQLSWAGGAGAACLGVSQTSLHLPKWQRPSCPGAARARPGPTTQLCQGDRAANGKGRETKFLHLNTRHQFLFGEQSAQCPSPSSCARRRAPLPAEEGVSVTGPRQTEPEDQVPLLTPSGCYMVGCPLFTPCLRFLLPGSFPTCAAWLSGSCSPFPFPSPSLLVLGPPGWPGARQTGETGSLHAK